jgi:uncharacterized membrane protein YqjE
MTGGNNHSSTGLAKLLGRMGGLALKTLQNRAELAAVELQEERLQLARLLMQAVGLVFLGTLGALLLSAVVIFLFPENLRIYVAAALGLLYLVGAVVAWSGLRSDLDRVPFNESIEQVKKDRVWLESLK